jgi:hypothetical protein
MQFGHSSLSGLVYLRTDVRSERVSSYDTAGGNRDWITLAPNKPVQIAEIIGAGCIKHIWMTMWCPEDYYARKIIIRAWWDGEKEPSIECPIGDFFGIGHGIVKNFWSIPLQMSPQDGRGFNCWFPMPFATSARFEIVNESGSDTNFYFYIDYERYKQLDDNSARFHAQWRRENPTVGWGEDNRPFSEDEAYLWEVWDVQNLDGEENFVILEAQGKGHYVGCHLDVDCFERSKNDWWGEGDDMIFIDGESWPPRYHGTGSEDYFNTAFCPKDEYCSPYQGLTVYSGDENWPWRGKNSLYRYHIEDPIFFEKSIKVTIEHGHANNLSNDYASTAYWYQKEPHSPFPRMIPVEKRLPRGDNDDDLKEKS